jgi:peptidoglycan/xylan/chitin deacetylase (PgdA/CDA1 family)
MVPAHLSTELSVSEEGVPREIAWKRRIGRLLSTTPRPNRKVILTYHAVGSGPWSLPVEAFAAQVDWLTRNAKVTTLPDLLKQEPTSGLRVALTFDDGYECVYRKAAPILQTSGMTATVFVNTTPIADNRQTASDPRAGHYPAEHFMTWPQVASLSMDGWEIGSHGAEHVDMTAQSLAEVRRQLAWSKASLEDRLGRRCEYFAYPWGRNNAAVRTEVSNCGYAAAAATLHGPLQAKGDRFALPRVDVRRDYAMSDFLAAVTGDWDYLRYVQIIRTALGQVVA